MLSHAAPWLRSCLSNSTTQSLLLGQVISLLIAGTGLFSTLLASRGVSIPTSQSSLNYALLLLYTIPLYATGGFHTLLHRPHAVRTLCLYALLAGIDVEANYLVVKSYSYTSVTSIMLIDCLAIPTAMALSAALLGARFSRRHVVGVGIAVVGLAVLVASDVLRHSGDDDSSPASRESVIMGDIMCAVAAALYGASNVGQEAMVKSHHRHEFLAMLGIFGSVVNTIQLMVLEREELTSLATDGVVIGCVVGFAVCLFTMYSLTPIFLARADATLFNLSLLTSDAWAIIMSVFLFHDTLHPLYFLALLLIVVGLVTYNSVRGPTAAPASAAPDEHTPVVASARAMLDDAAVGSTLQDERGEQCQATDVTRSPLFARVGRERSEDHVRILGAVTNKQQVHGEDDLRC